VTGHIKDFLKKNKINCTVCVDEFKRNEIITVFPQCKHIFHKRCILPWFLANDSCPNCRSKMDEQMSVVPTGEVPELWIEELIGMSTGHIVTQEDRRQSLGFNRS
jgi:hypothetical protein